jgi:hypothetical protein
MKSNKMTYVRTFTGQNITLESSVTLTITTQAAADFDISGIELYFPGRQVQATVARNYPDLKAFADITTVGSGLFKGEWRIDDITISTVEQNVIGGMSITLQTPQIPSLRTFDPGTHKVSFVITSPLSNRKAPIITYFVTTEAKPSEKNPEIKFIDISAQKFFKGIIYLDEPKWGIQPVPRPSWNCSLEHSDNGDYWKCCYTINMVTNCSPVAAMKDLGVPALNDKTRFKWHEENPGTAQWFELRFLDQGGNLIMKERMPDIWYYGFVPDVSFFEKYKQSAGASGEILWEVAGFRTYTKNGVAYDPQTDQSAHDPKDLVDKEVEISERWPLRLPDRPTGLSCPEMGYGLNNLSIRAIKQDQLNYYTGDIISIDGSFSLKNSPYAADSYASLEDLGGYYGTLVERFLNVFIDWGDGTIEPVYGSKYKDPTNIAPYPSYFNLNHKYEHNGYYSIRIYELPSELLQKGGLMEDLGAKTGKSPYLAAAKATLGIYGGQTADTANSLGNQAFDSAYMLYCHHIIINEIEDLDATGKLHLKSIEITGFSGQGTSSSQATVTSCDQGIVANAKLRYYGSGEIILSWKVDGVTITSENKQVPPSERRKWSEENHAWSQPDPIIDSINFTSPLLGVGNIGMRKVVVEASVVTDPKVIGSWAGGKQISKEIEDFLKNSPTTPVPGGPGGPGGPGKPLSGTREETKLAFFLMREDLSQIFKQSETMSDISHGVFVAAAKASSGAKAASSKSGAQEGQMIVGLLSPQQEAAKGKPAVVYVNEIDPDMLGAYIEADGGQGTVKVGGPDVESVPKWYKVVQADPAYPCVFHFPVKDGKYFVVQNINPGLGKVKPGVKKETDGKYYGKGTLMLNLTDSASGVTSHPVDNIEINGWIVNDGINVDQGEILVSPGMKIEDLPGMVATLKKLNGTAGDEVKATMDIKVSYNTLRLPDTDSPPGWSGLEETITPQGDWHAEHQTLAPSLIYWSAFQIKSDDVTIDLDHNYGSAADELCGGESGKGWVGIHLGGKARGIQVQKSSAKSPAKIIPYSLNLLEFEFDANNWGIVNSGICGEANYPNGFKKTIGEGWVSVDSITAHAEKGTFEASLLGFKVYVPWLDVEVDGGDAKITSGGGKAAQLAFIPPKCDPSKGPVSPNCIVPPKDYGNVVMKPTIVGFMSTKDAGWGIMTNTDFEFSDGGVPFTAIKVNKLFFDMFGRASFENGLAQPAQSVPPPSGGITFGLGGTYTLSSVKVSANVFPRIGFAFSGNLQIAKDFGSSTTVEYSIGRGQDKSYNAAGPLVAISPIKFQYGKFVGYNITPQYKGLGSSQTPNTHYQEMLFASLDPIGSGIGISDAMPEGTMLVAGNAGNTGSGPVDVYSGSIDLDNLFGMPIVPSIQAIFRLGYSKGEDYWLSYASADHLKIPLYGLIITKLGGGMGYNFPSAVFVNKTALTATPSMDGTHVYAGEFGLSSADGFGISVDGILTMTPSPFEVRMDFVNTNILGIKDILKGYFKYAGSSLDGQVWTPQPLEVIPGLSINVPQGSSGLHFGTDKWQIDMGTASKPLQGKVFFLNANAYYQIGYPIGYKVGGSVALNVNQCLIVASVDLHASAGAELHISPGIPPHITASVNGNIGFGGCLACAAPCAGFDMGIELKGGFPPPELGGCLSLDFGVKEVKPCLSLSDLL